MAKLQYLFLTVILLLTAFILLSCSNENDTDFEISLAGSEELVLSDEHIAAFNPDEGILELNGSGRDQWNSFMKYQGIPQLKDTLYTRDFVIKIDDDELCAGQFSSMVASTMPDSVIVVDCLIKLDEDHTMIKIGYFPSPETSQIYNDVISELTGYFEKQGKVDLQLSLSFPF